MLHVILGAGFTSKGSEYNDDQCRAVVGLLASFVDIPNLVVLDCFPESYKNRRTGADLMYNRCSVAGWKSTFF